MSSSPLVPADAAKRLALPDGYRGVPGHYDEAVDAAGVIRPAWQDWTRNCLGATTEELQNRDDACRRLLRDYGVTYTPPGADLEQDRPWLLDSWPVFLGAEEWEQLRRGVAQRARLLNGVLADISGPRELLLSGELPPEIVFANPAFLRAATGIEPPRGVHLGFYAVDLARSPDGRWWVVSDRTDTPAGAGYALENRIVLSRVYPDLIRDLHVQRLARFFAETRDGLLALAPGVDEPRVVILTPGPYSSTYFEQAYLARYLGFSLVEGGDLTVRDQGVFLKTLSGLLPVHVIVRRVASPYCDPLELREDSLLGVPGLLQAVRAGRVVVTNSIGAGVVETPALLPFLPGLCRRLLDEELLIPPVATWWCGQRPELNLVLKQLDQLVVKQAYPRRDAPSVRVTPATRVKLEAEIRARPHLYVGQEFVELSTSPSFQDGRLQPRHLMLRLFATADGDGDYRVMPGALARVAATAESVIMSELTGGGTKDTWVLGTGPADNTTLLPTGGRAAALSRAGFVLPSRLADDLFWLGRYLERVEFGARLARCLLHRLTDQTEHGQLSELGCLVELFAAHGRLTPAEIVARPWSPEHLEALLRRAVFDEANAGALVADIGRIHRIGVSVRDRLAVDAWRILHAMHEGMKGTSGRKRHAADAQLAALDQLLAQVSTFSGQSMDGMTRDKGWHFLEIGRRLERAADLCDLLRHGMAIAQGDEGPRLLAMLETANSAMTYRSRYVFGPEPAPVLDLLLADEGNPRSAVFQLASLYEHLKAIQPTRQGEPKSTEMKMVTTIFSEVRLVDVDSLVLVVRNGRRLRLVTQLRRITRAMEVLSQTLTRTYLTHVLAARPLGGGKS